MWSNPRETADLVTFTEEILNGILTFVKWFLVLMLNVFLQGRSFTLDKITINNEWKSCVHVHCSQKMIRLFARPWCSTWCSTLLKKLWHRCFPVNFAKFLRIPFLQNTSGQQLLLISFVSLTREFLNSVSLIWCEYLGYIVFKNTVNFALCVLISVKFTFSSIFLIPYLELQ